MPKFNILVTVRTTVVDGPINAYTSPAPIEADSFEQAEAARDRIQDALDRMTSFTLFTRETCAMFGYSIGTRYSMPEIRIPEAVLKNSLITFQVEEVL